MFDQLFGVAENKNSSSENRRNGQGIYIADISLAILPGDGRFRVLNGHSCMKILTSVIEEEQNTYQQPEHQKQS
jgi:hypothetical protein